MESIHQGSRYASATSREEGYERTFTHLDDSPIYLASLGLVRYRNKPDRSLHELRTAMHHNSSNQERALNLSILKMSGPDKFPRVESNYLDTIHSLVGISSHR